jgi:hypothetical protein
MTEDAKKVLAGFVRLFDFEKREVLAEIGRFQQSNDVQRSILQEEWTKAAGVYSGPVTTGCPCCGR